MADGDDDAEPSAVVVIYVVLACMEDGARTKVSEQDMHDPNHKACSEITCLCA